MKTKLTITHDSLRLVLNDGTLKVTLSVSRLGERASASDKISPVLFKRLFNGFRSYISEGSYGDAMRSLEAMAKECPTIPAFDLRLEAALDERIAKAGVEAMEEIVEARALRSKRRK